MGAVKAVLKRSEYGQIIINCKRILCQKLSLLLWDDYAQITRMAGRRLKRKINFKNPERFCDKLQWLKLFYRNSLMQLYADKVAIREYLSDKGYGDCLIPLVGKGVYNSVAEIDINELPDEFILKASHGSSMHLIKRKGQNVNWTAWKLVMHTWMKMNIYAEGREWPYHFVKPRIICESFVTAKTSKRLKDYKFFCMNGRPEFIQVDVDLISDHHVNFYDIEWKLLPLKCQYPNSKTDVQKPINFNRMIDIASDLSKDFPHVRVDFYEYDDQLRIGELTFFDGSGFYRFNPDEYDFVFGKKLALPVPNHNLDLFSSKNYGNQ